MKVKGKTHSVSHITEINVASVIYECRAKEEFSIQKYSPPQV